jgi:hypothetical protein
MRRLLLLIFLLQSALAIKAQSIGIGGAYISNQFYGSNDDERTSIFYKSATGYSFSIDAEIHKVALSVSFENYSGNIKKTYSGLAGTDIQNVEANKSVMAFNIYPFKWKIRKNWFFKPAVAFTFLLNEKIKGYYQSYPSFGTQVPYTDSDKLSNGFVFGFDLLMEYELKLSPRLMLVPQCQFYLGVTKEIMDSKSTREYFGIEIRKPLNK